MAVGGENDVFDARNARLDHAEDGLVLGRRGVADGFGNVDRGGSCLNGYRDHLDEKLGVGAGTVLGRELDVLDEGAGETDGFCCLLDGLLASDLELGFEVQVGGGEEDVDAIAGGGFNGAGGGFYVLSFAAGERGDAGAFD